MKLRIIIPTIDGREDHLKRCIAAYQKTAPGAELIVIRNKPTCGVAWQEGVETPGEYDFLHLTADDLVPHQGWLESALEICAKGNVPAPIQLHADGSVVGASGETGTAARMTVIPFCTYEQWQKIGPMMPWHYYTDDYFSVRAKGAGYQVLFHEGYRFTHNFAQVGRGAGAGSEQKRLDADYQLFMQWQNTNG